jgi:hypothetical protein
MDRFLHMTALHMLEAKVYADHSETHEYAPVDGADIALTP